MGEAFEAPPAARTVSVGGAPAAVIECGSGAPFLFLPPSVFLVARSYARVLEGLSRHHHVISPDQPGTGHSPPRDEPWNFEESARWAVGLLDALGIEKAVVAGHSTGGGIALVMAALYPERVERLVLVDTIGVPLRRTRRQVLGARFIDALLEMRLNAGGWRDILHNVTRHGGAFLHQINQSSTTDLTGYAPRVKAPTLLAWGGRDHTFPLASALKLQALLPEATLYVSPGGSHDWLLLQPERFAAAATEWAARPARRGPSGLPRRPGPQK